MYFSDPCHKIPNAEVRTKISGPFIRYFLFYANKAQFFSLSFFLVSFPLHHIILTLSPIKHNHKPYYINSSLTHHISTLRCPLLLLWLFSHCLQTFIIFYLHHIVLLLFIAAFFLSNHSITLLFTFQTAMVASQHVSNERSISLI